MLEIQIDGVHSVLFLTHFKGYFRINLDRYALSHFRSFTPILFTQARIIRLSLAPHYLGFEDDCLSRCPIDNCLNPKQPKQCPGPEEVNQQQNNRHEGHHAVAHQGAFVLFLPKSHAQDTRQDHTH